MTITGARFGYTVTTVKEGESEATEENKTAFVGTEGYVLTMEDNPLIQTEDMANKVMNILKKFRGRNNNKGLQFIVFI